mgnify:CR=1 FL=1|jgi:hypothetical protein
MYDDTIMNEAEQITKHLIHVGWGGENKDGNISKNLRGNEIGVVNASHAKVWTEQKPHIRARNVCSFALDMKIMNSGGGTGTPTIERVGEVVREQFAIQADNNGDAMKMIVASRLVEVFTQQPTEEVAPSVAPSLGSVAPQPTVAPTPTQTVVSDAVVIETIPTPSNEAVEFVLMNITGTDNMLDAVRSTTFTSLGKTKNFGKEVHPNNPHQPFANKTLGANIIGATGLSKAAKNEFATPSLLKGAYCAYEDLFAGIGIKKQAMNNIHDALDFIRDASALLYEVGSMDARRLISNKVKLAMMNKHYKYASEIGEHNILDTADKVTKTTTTSAAKQAQIDYFKDFQF